MAAAVGRFARRDVALYAPRCSATAGGVSEFIRSPRAGAARAIVAATTRVAGAGERAVGGANEASIARASQSRGRPGGAVAFAEPGAGAGARLFHHDGCR